MRTRLKGGGRWVYEYLAESKLPGIAREVRVCKAEAEMRIIAIYRSGISSTYRLILIRILDVSREYNPYVSSLMSW
jgi:hypothetical protein